MAKDGGGQGAVIGIAAGEGLPQLHHKQPGEVGGIVQIELPGEGQPGLAGSLFRLAPGCHAHLLGVIGGAAQHLGDEIQALPLLGGGSALGQIVHQYHLVPILTDLVDGRRCGGAGVQLGLEVTGPPGVVKEKHVALGRRGLAQVLPAQDSQGGQGGDIQPPHAGAQAAEQGEGPDGQQDAVGSAQTPVQLLGGLDRVQVGVPGQTGAGRLGRNLAAGPLRKPQHLVAAHKDPLPAGQTAQAVLPEVKTNGAGGLRLTARLNEIGVQRRPPGGLEKATGWESLEDLLHQVWVPEIHQQGELPAQVADGHLGSGEGLGMPGLGQRPDGAEGEVGQRCAVLTGAEGLLLLDDVAVNGRHHHLPPPAGGAEAAPEAGWNVIGLWLSGGAAAGYTGAGAPHTSGAPAPG